ncbi:hypothetical protein GCM10018965_018370 [Nonomuraea roseola]
MTVHTGAMTSDAGPPPRPVLADTARERIPTVFPWSIGKIAGCLDSTIDHSIQIVDRATEIAPDDSTGNRG